MKYTVFINSKTKKILSRIDKSFALKIRDKIRGLADNPRQGNVIKMKGGDNAYRLRVGDYRVIYEIDDNKVIILVVNVGHRRDVYKR